MLLRGPLRLGDLGLPELHRAPEAASWRPGPRPRCPSRCRPTRPRGRRASPPGRTCRRCRWARVDSRASGCAVSVERDVGVRAGQCPASRSARWSAARTSCPAMPAIVTGPIACSERSSRGRRLPPDGARQQLLVVGRRVARARDASLPAEVLDLRDPGRRVVVDPRRAGRVVDARRWSACRSWRRWSASASGRRRPRTRCGLDLSAARRAGDHERLRRRASTVPGATPDS